MAFWNPQQGWQTYNLPTNARTNFTSNDFAGQFPSVNSNSFLNQFPNKNENDFRSQFPSDRPTAKILYFQINGKGEVSGITNDPPDTKEQVRVVFLNGNGSSASDQLGDLFNKVQGNQAKLFLQNEVKVLEKNKIENSEAIQKRQQAANQFNFEQTKRREEEAAKVNNAQESRRQSEAFRVNNENQNINNKNAAINQWSANTANRLAAAKDGTYANNANSIESQQLKQILSPAEYQTYVKTAIDSFDGFYTSKVISKWDPKTQGAQPPVGGFDPKYYRTSTNGGAIADQQWNKALTSVSVGGKARPDLDIVGKYGSVDNYSYWYYTTQGKAAGDRGNAAKRADIAEDYKERLTDADFQQYRDNVLGLSDRFDNLQDWIDAQDPEILEEWVRSLPADQRRKFNDGTLPVPTLDNVPDRLRGKIVLEKQKTILEGKLGTVLGAKEKQQQQTFGSLTSDSLRQAAAKLQEVQASQTQFDFFSGLEGFNEIFSLNESIANSILGDTGVGGVLGFAADPERLSEGLEKSLGGVTGVPSRSNAVYNWQKWFDEQLVTRYKEGATFQNPLDPDSKITIDAEFAKDYIERYLKPRFDTSRSLTEFVSYLDVKQNEQNIFQTQSALDSLRDIADLRARAFLDGVRNKDPLNFDAAFYLNPTGNFSADDPKLARYEQQKNEVAKDWEDARKRGDTVKIDGLTWNQWAYVYGLDVNDPKQFAKLNYQVKGAKSGFDPARDLITLKDAEDYIQNSILPEIANEKLNIGDITFLNFVTPEEFADNLLEGIDPEKQKEEFEKVLETLGLSGEELGIDEVKQYIIEAFRTGAAQKIRESIKFLNEKKLRPTQERLGVDYIERPEDFKPTDSPNQTELFRIFKNAGYQGSEDEFYDSFLTDVDRGEIELLTQGQKGLQLGGSFAGLTSRDPFEALGAIQNLFPDEDTKTTSKKKETTSSTPSYFSIFTDSDKEEEDYKSKSGQKILGEFTSFFKGFS